MEDGAIDGPGGESAEDGGGRGGPEIANAKGFAGGRLGLATPRQADGDETGGEEAGDRHEAGGGARDHGGNGDGPAIWPNLETIM